MTAEQSDLLASAQALAESPFTGLFDFSNTACVITGGAKGIGKATALRFAQLGARVTIVDLGSDADAAAAEIAESTGVDVDAASADVRDAAALAEIAETATNHPVERIVWANCAGIYPSHRLEELDEEQWRSVLDINLDGTFYGSRAAAMAAARHSLRGVIVNISSVAGSRAGWPPGIAHYVASKHAVEGLTKALAVELGPRGIRVVCVAPGTVVTDGLIARFGAPGGDDDPYLQLARRMPVRRPALPDDIARTIVFLASDAAAMVTGCTLAVDGGHLAT